MNVYDWVNTQPARDAEPGRWRCAFFAADWVRHRTGLDLASPWRKGNAGGLHYARVLQAHGGLAAMIDDAAPLAGLQRVASEASVLAGDVAVVGGGALLKRPLRQWAAVALDTFWVIDSADGLYFMRRGEIEMDAAWSVPCLR